jgi:histidine phosphotransferase ChpT
MRVDKYIFDKKQQHGMGGHLMHSELKLAEMLCTRLCHDLTGPIGAVNNGAEFLEEEGFRMEHEALQLILSSAAEAVHRLQFYRMAYGRLGDGGEACLAQKKEIVEDFFSTTKIAIDWPDSHTDAAQISISQRMSRLILNLLIIASGALIKGGRIAVRLHQEPNGDKRVSIHANGDMIKMDDDILRVLRREVPLSQLNPKTAQLALTLMLAEEIDAKLDFVVSKDSCQIAVEQKAAIPAEASHSFA